MSVRTIWNEVEKVLGDYGWVISDVDDVQQERRCTIRIAEVPTQQRLRGAIGSGVVRITWNMEVVLYYNIGTNKRIERKVAEDAEDILAAIYASKVLVNHYFDGATIERDASRLQVMNTMKFVFQDQAA